MRPARTIRVVAAVWVALAAGGWAARGQGAAGPSTTRGAAPLPRPPRQDQPWDPPRSTLPIALSEAARVLFAQGLADPRGCGYREVELAGEAEYDRHRTAHPRPIHAWVLPFEATGGPRYAVGWNGLVYPVTRMGPAADLEADVRALEIPGGAAPRGGQPWSWPAPLSTHPMYQGRAFDDIETASQDTATLLKVVLLLRLGRADLAERAWKAGGGWQKDSTNNQVSVYANIAADWEWALLDRAAWAHARGDDPLALASLREIARIRPMIEAQPGVVKPPPFPGNFDFLVEFPRFLADQERRARAPARRPAVEAAFPDRAARIAALIRDFDRISSGHPNQQGGLSPFSDAAYQAIVKEGDAAVGPLLDGLERDDRLTRAVVRFGPNIRFLHVRGVDELAYEALVSILGTRELGPQARYYTGHRADRMSRRAVAAEIRDYWRKNRKLGPLDRLFATLADDAATTEQWLAAAESLVQHIIVRRPGLEYMTIGPRSRGVPLRGEPLRSRTDPSVTELLARRTREIDGREGHPDVLLHLRPSNRMALSLAAWDPKGALPTLRACTARSVAALRAAPANQDTIYVAEVEVKVAAFAMLRARAGDLAALDEYADWIRTRPRAGWARHLETEVFQPMWSYADHPSIAAAAVALFDRAGSPWVPLFGPDDRGWGPMSSYPCEIIASPMLGVAPFRKLVLAGLKDDRPSGVVRCDADGKVTIVMDKQTSLHPVLRPDDPDRPRPGTTEPIRLCDKYAWKLQEVVGFPRLEFQWPRERRDRAVAGALEILSRYGERFRTTEVSQALYEKASFYPRFQKAVLVFPPMDRPATAEDVAAGRAIVAATPGVEARRWPMPTVPMEARWMEQEIAADDPFVRQFEELPPKHSSQLGYVQHGLVWQAEESREGGRWRRYYGFVGHHVIARLPAEEVDFPAEWNTGWAEIARDFEAKLIPPGGRDDGLSILLDPVAPGGPLPVVLSLRNRRGISVTAPTDLARPGTVPTLRDGVMIRVSRRPEVKREDPVAGMPRPAGPPAPRAAVGPSQQGGYQPPLPWPEIAARREPERHRSDAAKALEPTGTAEVLRFDLRGLFDLDAPGHYRVEVELPGVRTEEGTPAPASAEFDVQPADSGPGPR